MPDEEPWPKYFPLPKDAFHAVGALAAVFNSLEQRLLLLMIPYLGKTTTARISRERNNQLKSDLLRCATVDRAETKEIASAIAHFCDGFDRCAANRNIIMHSRTIGASKKGDEIQTILRKLSSGGDRYNEFRVPLDELREIVDNTFRFDRYGERIWFHVVSSHHTDLAPSIDHPQPLPPPPPLPRQLLPDTTG